MDTTDFGILQTIVQWVQLILLGLLQGVVVPASLLIVIYTNAKWAYTNERSRDPGITIEHVLSAKYGFWTGVFLFFIIMTIKFSTTILDIQTTDKDSIVGIVLAIAIGFAFGFINLLAIEKLSKYHLIGFVVAFSVAGAATSLLFYIFNDDLRVNLMVAAFAFLAGVFSYAMISNTQGLLSVGIGRR